MLGAGKLIWLKYVIRALGEPASETPRHGTWRDRNNASQVGGGERNQTMKLACGRITVAIECR